MRWYKALCLNGSNFTMFLLIGTALYVGRIVDASVFFALFISSEAYHACHSELFCIGPLPLLRSLDYAAVWSNVLYIFILTLSLSMSASIALWVFLTVILALCSGLLVNSALIPAMIFLGAVITYATRLLWFGKPIKHADWLFVILSGGDAVISAVFFFYDGDIYGSTYWWSHSIWHVVVMVGEYFVYDLAIGESIILWCGIDLMIEDARDWVAGAERPRRTHKFSARKKPPSATLL